MNTARKPSQKTPNQPPSKSKNPKKRELPVAATEYFDSHCHLDWILKRAFEEDHKSKAKPEDKKEPAEAECCREPAGNKGAYDFEGFARERFLGKFDGCVTVCCAMGSVQPTLDLLNLSEQKQDEKDVDPALYARKIYASFGIHPHEARHYNDKVEKKLIELAAHPRVVAWGECGLDFFYNHSAADIQKKAFIRQIQCAVKLSKPLVIHSRDAEEDTIAIMKEHVPKDWKIHLHCFTGSQKMATTMLDLFPNLCIGFTGCITFPKAQEQRDVVKSIPLERLLLETDGPYMAPGAFRGLTAHPGMIPLIASCVAEVKGVTVDEVLKTTRENTKRIYGV